MNDLPTYTHSAVRVLHVLKSRGDKRIIIRVHHCKIVETGNQWKLMPQ